MKEEIDFYNRIGKINGWNFSSMKYETIDNSQFKYFEEVNNNISNDTILLDMGTGGGEKFTSLISNNCLLKIGTDYSKEMVNVASKNNHSGKIRYFLMDSEKLLFPDGFFDIVCARHTSFNPQEVKRVLKGGGLFFSEQIDEDDCLELKQIFGRGQGFGEKNKLIDIMKSDLSNCEFKSVKFYEINQDEYYKNEDDLLFLLKNTPIIPNFCKEEKDFEYFKEYVKNNKTDKGIYLKRKLFGIKIVK